MIPLDKENIRGVYGTVARTSGKGRRRTGQEE